VDGPDRSTPRALANGEPAHAATRVAADPLEEMLRDEPAPTEHRHAPTPPLSPERQREREEFLRRLEEEPWKYDFLQTVRRLSAMFPEFQGVGLSDRVTDDPMRFCQVPSLAFPPCNLQRYDPAEGDTPARLFVNFMGMLGPNGPLPLHLTEYAHERELHHKDFTFSRFLDLFNHRLISLFYRAWAVNQVQVSFDRSVSALEGAADDHRLTPNERQEALLKDSDHFAIYIGSLFGLGMDSLRFRDAVPDTAKLHFAGRLAPGARGPEGLRSILAEYFGVQVEVEEFSGVWLDLPEANWCRLGFVPGRDPQASSLGSLGGGGAISGTRAWDCQGRFKMRLGPMSLADYQRLLPGTPSCKRLTAWIRNYLGDEFSWDATLILKNDEVPRTQLGGGARLGWTTWTYSGGCDEHRADLAIRSEREVRVAL
jgi:type VI secretion system protein ImpH